MALISSMAQMLQEMIDEGSIPDPLRPPDLTDPVASMPVPNDQEANAARRRRMVSMLRRRRGRASTIMTDLASQPLGA